MKKVFGPAERSSRLLEVESEANGKFSLCVKDERGAYHTIFIAPSDAPALALAILEAAGYDDMADDANLADVHAFNAMHKLQESVDTQERATAEAKEQAELEAEALAFFNAYDNVPQKMSEPPLESFVGMPRYVKDRWLAVDRFIAKIRAEAKAEALNEMAKELENQLAGITRETGQTRSGRDIIRRIRTRANQYKEAPSA